MLAATASHVLYAKPTSLTIERRATAIAGTSSLCSCDADAVAYATLLALLLAAVANTVALVIVGRTDRRSTDADLAKDTSVLGDVARDIASVSNRVDALSTRLRSATDDAFLGRTQRRETSVDEQGYVATVSEDIAEPHEAPNVPNVRR